MERVKPYTRKDQDKILGYTFFCPGCNEIHAVGVGYTNGKANWSFNGDTEKPTFHPSVLLRSGHYASSHDKADGCWCTYNKEHPNNPTKFTCKICHSFVKEGKIQFLNDCTHELAGKTVDLPEVK